MVRPHQKRAWYFSRVRVYLYMITYNIVRIADSWIPNVPAKSHPPSQPTRAYRIMYYYNLSAHNRVCNCGLVGTTVIPARLKFRREIRYDVNIVMYVKRVCVCVRTSSIFFPIILYGRFWVFTYNVRLDLSEIRFPTADCRFFFF